MNMHIPSRQNIFREMRDYLMIALGMIMYGIGWTVFLLPNDITTGGVPGIASLVYFLYEKIKITPVFMAPLLSLWC